jgi:hypothetical protein
MPYHGYIEITVRLARQGSASDGSKYETVADREVRVELPDARGLVAGSISDTEEITTRLTDAVRQVLEEDEANELQDRWLAFTGALDFDGKKMVLDLYEAMQREGEPRG